MRGLTVRGNEGEPDLLRVDRLRLYYRPLRLLQGRFDEAFSEIRILNSTVFIDARLSERVESTFIELLAQNSDPDRAALPDDLIVSARNLDVEVVTDEQSFGVQDLFFDVDLADSILQIRANGEITASDLAAELFLNDLSGAFELSGTVDLELGTTLAEVRVLAVESDFFELSDVTVQVRLDEERLEIRNVQSRDPIDLFYRFSEEEESSYARVLVDGFELARIIRFKGALSPFNEVLSFPVRGQASITATPGSTTYGVSLSSNTSRTGAIPPGTVAIRLNGNEAVAEVEQLSFRSPEGSAVYEGSIELDPIRPRGRLVVDRLSLSGTEPLSTIVSFGGAAEEVVMSTAPFELNGVMVPRLDARISYGENARVSFGMAFGGGDPATLAIDSTHSETWALLSAELALLGADVEDIIAMQAALFPAVETDTIQALFSNAEVTLRASSDLTSGTVVRVSEFRVEDLQNRSEYLAFRGGYEEQRIRVDGLRFGMLGVSGQGAISGTFARGAIEGEGEIALDGVEYGFTYVYEPDRLLEIAGERDARLSLRFGPDGSVSLESDAEIPLPSVGRGNADLTLNASGRFFNNRNWSANLEALEVSGFSTETLTDIALSLSGSVSQSGASFEEIRYADQFSSLTGGGEAEWDLDEGFASFQISVENTQYPQGEWYILSGVVSDASIESELLARGSPVERFGITSFSGGVHADVALRGDLDDPTLAGELSLVDGRFNNDPLNFEATIRADRRTATIEQARGQFGRTRVDNFSAGVSLPTNRVAVEATVTQSRDRRPLSVTLAAQAIYARLDQYVDILSNDLDAQAVVSGLPSITESDGLTDWEFSIDRENGFTVIEGGPDSAIQARFSPAGDFEATIGGALPLAFEAIGYLSSGRLEMDLIDVEVDINRFAAVFDDAEFAIDGGQAEGSVRIVGPINDPDFYGTLVARDVTGRVDLIPVALGPSRVFLVFEEKLLTIRESRVPAGDAAALVGAQLVFDRWGVEQYQVRIATVGGRPLPVDSVFGGVLVRGDAIGEIELRGDRGSFALVGDITASSTAIAIGEADRDDDEIDQDTTIGLTIESGRGVEFLWPNENVPILRGFAAAGETVTIAVQSETGSFGVDGTVGIQGGEIFYFDRSFYITEGEIIFAEDQTEFDPRLSVQAEIREISEEGPVRIYLVADENPLSEFSPRWRSDPPLSETDILALLGGTVFIGESGEPIDFSQAVLLTSDFVSQFGLIRNFERSVRDALQLDLFSIRTQLFQNLLRGVIDQNAAVPLDTTVPSLGQYLDNTTLFAGRYLGTDLFLEMFVQVSETEAEPGSPQSLTGIEVDSEVSLEWETPFFQLEWAFFPRDPSTLFLTDNTIRFSWDFSY
ncbi:MAG: translocation/assembly module TamB domain-containing protein [Spirochaetales bacterium]